MFKRLSIISYILSAFILIFAGVLVAKGAWNAPTQTAPNGNTQEPINVGATDQTKTGGNLNILGTLNAVGGLFAPSGFGVQGISLFNGASTFKDGDITLGTPTNQSSPSNSLNMWSWASTISTITTYSGGSSSPTGSDVITNISGVDNCPGFNSNGVYGATNYDSENKFSCQEAKDHNITITPNFTCTDVYHISAPVSEYIKGTVTCNSGSSNYSIKNNSGIFQIVSDSNGKLTLDQSGNLSATGKINSNSWGVSAPGSVLTATDNNGNAAWSTLASITANPSYWSLSGSNLTASSTDYNVGIGGDANSSSKLSVIGNIILSNSLDTSGTQAGNFYKFDTYGVDNSTLNHTPECVNGSTTDNPSIQDMPNVFSAPGSAKIGDVCYDWWIDSSNYHYANKYVVQSFSATGGRTYTPSPVLTFNDFNHAAWNYNIKNDAGILKFIDGTKTKFSVGQTGSSDETITANGDLVVNGNGTVTGTAVSGGVATNNFQLGTSATADQVLTTDANGKGTWQPLPAYNIVTGGGLQKNGNNFGLTTSGCSKNQILQFDGSAWSCTNLSVAAGGPSYWSLSSDSKSIAVSSIDYNIGIGTLSPNSKLDVTNGADEIMRLTRTGATYPTIFREGMDGAFVINNGNSDLITLTSGNVGIGTSNPGSYKLNVNGDLSVGGKADMNGPSNFYSGASVANSSAITFYPGTLSAQPQTIYTDWAGNATPLVGEWYTAGTAGQNSDTCSGNDSQNTFVCTGSNTQSKCFDEANLKIGGTSYGSAIREISCAATAGVFSIKNDGADSNKLKFINGSNSIVLSIDQPGNINVSGNLTAGKFIGDGSGLVSIPFSSITGYVVPTPPSAGVNITVDANNKISVVGNPTFTGKVTANGGVDSTGDINASGHTITAQQYNTGDIIFNHDGKPVWRMYEDENGLYAQSPITGKKYKMMMEELPQ